MLNRGQIKKDHDLSAAIKSIQKVPFFQYNTHTHMYIYYI